MAHGYLTLSLGPVLMPQVAITTGFKMGVNYGCNKVRFMSPVPVGAKLRLGVKLLQVDDIPGGIQTTYEFVLSARKRPSRLRRRGDLPLLRIAARRLDAAASLYQCCSTLIQRGGACTSSDRSLSRCSRQRLPSSSGGRSAAAAGRIARQP
ncbi:MAG: hypothetical protein R2694_15515 [Ilumatobacteraceae bacterium]